LKSFCAVKRESCVILNESDTIISCSDKEFRMTINAKRILIACVTSVLLTPLVESNGADFHVSTSGTSSGQNSLRFFSTTQTNQKFAIMIEDA
jgi:hypothetical protein